MSKFKLVTIICEPVLSANLIAMIRSMGATGFTVTDVRGEGSGDKRSGEIPSEKTKIEVIIGADSSQQIMSKIAEAYFQNYSLIVYASDIQVIRNEKF